MLYKKFIYIILFIFLFYIIFPLSSCFALDDSIYVWSSNYDEAISTNSEAAKSDNFLDLSCGSAVLIEQSTGKVLYEHNMHDQLKPASVTKVMTILLIMEALDSGKISLDDNVSCSENAASMGGSQIWLEVRRNSNCK